MLTKNHEEILREMIKICPTGYKLVTCEDFNKISVEEELNFLSEKGLINIKYSLNGEYLIGLLPNGKNYFDNEKQQLNLEKEALGFNLIYSYFARYQTIKNKYNCKNLINYDLKSLNRSIVTIKYIRVIKTKKNDEMAFVTIYDDSMEMDAVLFPLTYIKYKDLIEMNKTYLITYKIEIREEKEQAIIDSIYNLN